MPAASPSYDPADDTRRMAAGLLGMIRLAREMVALHRPVDLAGLDDKVGMLCARALDLPEGQGRGLLPALDTLITALDALRHTLQDAA